MHLHNTHTLYHPKLNQNWPELCSFYSCKHQVFHDQCTNQCMISVLILSTTEERRGLPRLLTKINSSDKQSNPQPRKLGFGLLGLSLPLTLVLNQFADSTQVGLSQVQVQLLARLGVGLGWTWTRLNPTCTGVSEVLVSPR